MCAKQFEQKYNFPTINSENYLHPYYVPRNSRPTRHSISSSSSGHSNDEGNPNNLLKLRRISQSTLTFSEENNKIASIIPDKCNLNASNESICFGKFKKPQATKEIFDIFRPRCYTDPGPATKSKKPRSLHITVPLLKIESNAEGKVKKKRKKSNSDSSGPSVFQSLIKQTLKLSAAPMGMKAAVSAERLTQNSPTLLTENVKHQISRSTNSIATLPNGIDAKISNHCNLTGSTSSTLLHDHKVEAKSVECCLNQYDVAENVAKHQNNDEHCVAADGGDNLNDSSDVELRKSHRKQLSSGSATSQNSGYYSTLSNNRNQNLSGSHRNRGARTLKQNKSESAIPTNPVLALDSLSTIPSTHSLRSISPTGSRQSTSGSISSNNSDNTAKRDELSTAAAVGTTTTVAAIGAAGALGQQTDKEKKRKEVSSSRVKKFHRHFSQVSKDEKLINYFSCALVSDILLQGHLYITDQHFAFYSNVFGYVTKVVIPTSSVTKISKEKTAKIIPNAVGVATAEERHVFGSFISREAAFRLMCSVCPPLGTIEMLPKSPADIEISEEYSIEDDSSCSISGNESPPNNGGAIAAACNTHAINANTNQILTRRTILSSSLNSAVIDKKSPLNAGNDKMRHSDIPLNAKIISSQASNATMQHGSFGLSASAPPLNSMAHHKLAISNFANAATGASNLTMIIAAGAPGASVATTPSTTSSSPTTVMATPTAASSNSSSIAFHFRPINTKETIMKSFADRIKGFTSQTSLRLKFPTELSIVYLGVVLSVILAVFSVFLLYRIVDIEARATLYRSPMNFNWHSGHDDDIFAEALRWQRQLQDKSTAEAQSILSTNLEQIAKVRRSLETLSMLIRDRSSASTAAVHHQDDSSD